MTGKPPVDDRDGGHGDDWAARREALTAKLGAHRAQRQAENAAADRSKGFRGAAEGFKIASEFVAGIAVGAAIGYFIDLVAGTSPFGLIVFLMFGFAAGVLNVVRATSPSKDGEAGGKPGDHGGPPGGVN